MTIKTKECEKCKTKIVVKSNATKYCPNCAAKRKKLANLFFWRRRNKVPLSKPVRKNNFIKNEKVGVVSKDGKSTYKPMKWEPVTGQNTRRESILKKYKFDENDEDELRVAMYRHLFDWEDELEARFKAEWGFMDYWRACNPEMAKSLDKFHETWNNLTPTAQRKALEDMGKAKYRAMNRRQEFDKSEEFRRDMEVYYKIRRAIKKNTYKGLLRDFRKYEKMLLKRYFYLPE